MSTLEAICTQHRGCQRVGGQVCRPIADKCCGKWVQFAPTSMSLHLQSARTPSPKARTSRSGQPPVETINIVTEQPSQPATRYNAIADTGSPHATTGTMTARSTRTPHEHSHRAWHGIRVSTSSPREVTSNQPAYRTSTTPPRHRYAMPRSKTSSLQSRGQPPRAYPTSSRLGSEDSLTVACAQGPRKLFREAQGHPSENSSASTFRFFPCTAAFPQALSAPQGAPKGGRAPTQGGRQPWERASTRGRTRQSSRT